MWKETPFINFTVSPNALNSNQDDIHCETVKPAKSRCIHAKILRFKKLKVCDTSEPCYYKIRYRIYLYTNIYAQSLALENIKAFLKNTAVFKAKHHRVFLKGGHLLGYTSLCYLLDFYAIDI